MISIKDELEFKSLFLPRVAEFIYIEGDNKRVSSAGIINFIYNETIVSRALPSSLSFFFVSFNIKKFCYSRQK